MMSARLSASAAIFAAVALVACSEPAPGAPPQAPIVEGPEPRPMGPGATVGGDGSDIVLNGLNLADIEARDLPGELACSFMAGPDEDVILLARGDVASSQPAVGVVKVGDYVERLAAPGGFDGMIQGATFAGRGKTVEVDVTGQPVGGGESPPRPATLTYQRADGASRAFPGQWTCGP